MNRWNHIFGGGLLAVFLLSAAAPALASTGSAIENDLTQAMARGDCTVAVDLVNRGAGANDARVIFWGGRMLDEGFCSKLNRAAAATFFERAARLGDRDAGLEFAAHVGLGEGGQQDYERAGQLCRAAGFDAPAKSSLYSLGYACTVGAAAARLARLNLPANALQTPVDAAMIDFRPASAQLRVLSAPKAVVERTARLGSHIRRPLVDVSDVIEQAWRGAAGTVPKPEAARLQDTAVELPLDLDPRLESIGGTGTARNETDLERLQFLSGMLVQPPAKLGKSPDQ